MFSYYETMQMKGFDFKLFLNQIAYLISELSVCFCLQSYLPSIHDVVFGLIIHH